MRLERGKTPIWPWLSVVFGALLIAACASQPRSDSLPRAKIAVDSLSAITLQRELSSEINATQTKLTAAEKAKREKNFTQSEFLAQQVLVDVEIIKVRAQRILVQQSISKLQTEISSLQREVEWREPVTISPLDAPETPENE